MQASARRDGEDWILNGSKTHVNMGHDCDVTLFYAIAEEGLTSFLVDMSLPGISTRKTDPIGLRMIPTADIVFDNVRIPGSAVLGPVGAGMKTFLSTFNVSRLGNASELIGLGRRALSLGLEYAKEREVSGHKVVDFQGLQWQFTEAWSALYGASLARDQSIAVHRANGQIALETSVTKLLAANAAEQASHAAHALTGGHALYHDQPFLQVANDIRVLRVAGGSVEVLRNYISRAILKDDGQQGLA